MSDSFGRNVIANEELIVVSATNDDTSGVSNSGTVYVFNSDTGALRHTLFSPHLKPSADFGQSIALTPQGDILVGEGAATVNDIAPAGRVYLFDDETGNLLLDIPNPFPTVRELFSDGFSISLAAIDNRIFVSAHNANVPGFPSAGVVYVFEGIPEPSTFALLAAFLTSVTVYYGRHRMRLRRT